MCHQGSSTVYPQDTYVAHHVGISCVRQCAPTSHHGSLQPPRATMSWDCDGPLGLKFHASAATTVSGFHTPRSEHFGGPWVPASKVEPPPMLGTLLSLSRAACGTTLDRCRRAGGKSGQGVLSGPVFTVCVHATMG